MNTSRKFTSFAALGAALFAASAFAQTGTPVAEPPPIAPSPVPPAATEKSTEAPISLTDATNATGKTSGNNTVKELRFSAVDLDSNGLISLAEFTAFMEPASTTRSAGNAEVTSVNPVELLFRRIDQDSDNYLSEKEVTAYQDEQNRTPGATR